MLWSLKREAFKQIQAVSACSMQMQRARCAVLYFLFAVLFDIDLFICHFYVIFMSFLCSFAFFFTCYDFVDNLLCVRYF